jgi:predicted extracellular nuclease
MKKIQTSLLIALVLLSGNGFSQTVIFTQYYEGTSNNKWIEIKNISQTSIDLDLGVYNLSIWSNANTEAYKSDGAPSATLALTGVMASGEVRLIYNSNSTLPAYALTYDPRLINNTVANFNGDDSLTLWTGATFSTASIIDAIGFTDLGNEGADTSFVRISNAAGWNTTSGSTVENFPSVWSEVTLAAVADAAVGSNERLGFSTVAVVPEPSTYAMLALAGAGFAGYVIRRRRR